jgi:hypothetical protein
MGNFILGKKFEPLIIIILGNVFLLVKVHCLFILKENSSLNKECFVNLFYGNNMKIKPVLLSAYCGFSRNNNP